MFTLTSFAAHLAGMVIEVEHVTHHALERSAVIVEAEAKAEIGTYQAEAPPFAAWAPLTPGTMADRVAKGFTPDDPLLRTGQMRDSIEHVVHGHTAHVGLNDPIALYQELGTSRIPPRSFLGGAAVRKEAEVREVCGGETAAFLAGGKRVVPIR